MECVVSRKVLKKKVNLCVCCITWRHFALLFEKNHSPTAATLIMMFVLPLQHTTEELCLVGAVQSQLVFTHVTCAVG